MMNSWLSGMCRRANRPPLILGRGTPGEGGILVEEIIFDLVDGVAIQRELVRLQSAAGPHGIANLGFLEKGKPTLPCTAKLS